MRGGCPLAAWACPCQRTENWLLQGGGFCKSHSWMAFPAPQAAASGLHLTWTASSGVRGRPPVQPGPCRPCTDAWGWGSADPRGSAPGLLLPAHGGRPRARLHFVKKVSSLQNQNVPGAQHWTGGISCKLPIPSAFASKLGFLEHPVLAEHSWSTVTVVLGGRNQDLREVPQRHTWPPEVTAESPAGSPCVLLSRFRGGSRVRGRVLTGLPCCNF